jgi:hypothetical protein
MSAVELVENEINLFADNSMDSRYITFGAGAVVFIIGSYVLFGPKRGKK